MGGVDGGPLLGYTRSHEHRLDVGTEIVAEYPGHRHHGGDHRRQIGHQPGMVLAHIRDHGRAGGGDVAAFRVFLQQLAVFVGDEIGSQSHLMHGVEAQGPDHGDQLAGRDIGEFSRETGGDHGRHVGDGTQQPEGPFGVVAHLLGVLATDPETVAAADAAGLDDPRLSVDHLDGFGRALPHAGIAHPALVGDYGDEGVVPGGHQSSGEASGASASGTTGTPAGLPAAVGTALGTGGTFASPSSSPMVSSSRVASSGLSK